ncbi:MAG: glycosyltransferase, partial [Bacteroidales bacterium]|nr:glycosyltransferase [Bacteroidales bacterium]
RDIFKEQIQSKIYFVSGNPGEDLYALSTCDYIIGPPSTFSLMAAFYEDANLYWIMDKNAPVTKESFKKFDYLFRHIL